MGGGEVLFCVACFVVFLVVRGDENKTTLSIAICHPHKSAAWATCEVGDGRQTREKQQQG